MPHSMILGMTESGKTTLAKVMVKRYRSRGVGVVLLDPLNDPGFRSGVDDDMFFNTDDAATFLRVVKESRQCAVFIDESGESVGQYDTEMHWLATRGRHYGHNCHFITQRGAQIAKTVRDQCSNLFLFNCSMDDSKILSNEFNKEELRTANTLNRGEYLAVSRFGGVTRHKIF